MECGVQSNPLAAITVIEAQRDADSPPGGPSSNMQASRTLKVVLIGDGDAGKTSLRQRYLTDRFQHAYRATIGADFVSKTVEVTIPSPTGGIGGRSTPLEDGGGSSSSGQADDGHAQQQNGGKDLASAAIAAQTETVRVTLSVWDTAGQERFRSLGTAFYRGADAAVIAFDVNKRGALQRTLSWYRDFCSMGGLGMDGEEEERGMTPKQIRSARERRERFCWVAVGCKGDLLQQQHDDSDESGTHPTTWAEARGWFDGVMPHYLPAGETEEVGEFDVPTHHPASAQAIVKPYRIDGEAPALPEDVLSRPSPNNHHASLLPHNSNESSQSRHPEAGTPPGEAARPGSGMQLRKQSSSDHLARQTAVLPIDKLKQSPSRQGDGGSQLSTASSSSVTQGTMRSRYDSAVSTSGQSVYYSLRGSTMNGRSSESRSQSTDDTERYAGGSVSSKARPFPEEAANGSASDDEADTIHGSKTQSTVEQNARPRLQAVFSNESSATARARPSEADEGAADSEGGGDIRSAGSIVPSGDPIPFPSEDDHELLRPFDGGGRAGRRTSRFSRTSTRRHSRGPSIGQANAGASEATATSTELIAEQVKSEREAQAADESADTDRRATLYSARPSSCNSTIRPADADVGDVTASSGLADRAEVPIGADGDDEDGQEPVSSSKADEVSRFYEDQIEQGFRLFYTSAKTGTSVDDVFQHIARRSAIRWAYEEWEERQRREMWGYDPHGVVRTAPPIDEEIERERMRRAIKISQGKSVGGCCS